MEMRNMKHRIAMIAACALIFAGTMPATAGTPDTERAEQNVKKTAVKTITYDPAKTDVTKLKAALEKLGYKVQELSGKA